MLAEALTALAIVVQDGVPLRAAPADSAPQQAVLWQGENLEVRGARLGYLQVYDHRLERGGYVRAGQVRQIGLKPENAPELLAVVRFLKDTPGEESLGIAYTAAYLKAAPAEAIGAEAFDALGTLADRLARRASYQQSKANAAALSGQLEVAASYGVAMQSFERDDRMVLCYEGEALRRVLALPASDEQKARAALALTRHDCVDPKMGPLERYKVDQWRAEALDRFHAGNLPDYLKTRVHARRAGVWASLAHQSSRRGEDPRPAAERALQELAAVDKNDLAEMDTQAYAEAAARVGASRWAAEAAPSSPGKSLGVVTAAGEQGETCVLLVDAKHGQSAPLFKRCTYGTVWTASARANPAGTALALAVQPLDTWRELWVFRKGENGWTLDVLPPAANVPDVGYIEFAGWVPGTTQMLAAREAKTDGVYRRSFEVIELNSLETKHWSGSPNRLAAFQRWQDPVWKRVTVSVR